MNFTPHPHQQVIIDHIHKHKRCAVWSFMGSGKSAAALEALNRISLTEDIFPILIIAPLRVITSVWPVEIVKWDNFKNYKISVVRGDVKERWQFLHNRKSANIYAINYENIEWLIKSYGDKWPFKTVICDEMSKLKGFRLRQGTKRAKALSEVAFRSEFFIGLTGTPAANGVKDLWGQLWFLDKGQRLGRTFTSFTDRWFQLGFDGYSLTPMSHAQKEIEALLKDICISIRTEDYFPVDEPIRTVVPVKLPVVAQKQYKEFERDMFMKLKDREVEAVNAAVLTGKCHQFANGAVYVDDKQNWAEVHAEKIAALESIIEEAAGAPVLVAYNFKSDLERLEKAFPKAWVLGKDPKDIDRWNAGKVPLMFAHPASAGHGLNLAEGGNILVYFSLNWNLEDHQQILERIGPARQKQCGLNRAVYVYSIIAEGTIDELIQARLDSKKSVQEILMEAMSQRCPNGET